MRLFPCRHMDGHPDASACADDAIAYGDDATGEGDDVTEGVEEQEGDGVSSQSEADCDDVVPSPTCVIS